MPMYFPPRDLDTLRGISRELVQKVMDVDILFFKLNPQKMQMNIYGQAKHKTFNFYPGIYVKGMVVHNAQELTYNESVTYKNNTTFKFLVSTLQSINLYPQVADILGWNGIFWEITKVTQQQLIGNRSDTQWSKICQTTALSNSKVNQLKELRFV